MQQDNNTVHVRVPKSAEMGVVNNQQENFSFKAGRVGGDFEGIHAHARNSCAKPMGAPSRYQQ